MAPALRNPEVGPAPVRAIFAFRASAPRAPGSAVIEDDTYSPAELLLRYETAYDRQFNRALTKLMALQIPIRPILRPLPVLLSNALSNLRSPAFQP